MKPGRQFADIVQYVTKAGYLPFFASYYEKDTALRGVVHLNILSALRTDPRFKSGIGWGMHRDVGTNLTDFRSLKGEIFEGGDFSLQLVIDKITGECYGDLDLHNPYADVVSHVAHWVVEVFPWFRRDRRGRSV